MQKPYVLLDDTGSNHKHGSYFETVAAAHAYTVKHNLQLTHLIYDLSNAPVITDPALAIELEANAQSHRDDATTVQRLIDKLTADYEANPDTFDLMGCDDIDELIWNEVMNTELGPCWPDDNNDDAEIYEWMLTDHITNGTTVWTYEQVCNNTDMGTSGRDSWQYVADHLVHIGLMSPRTQT